MKKNKLNFKHDFPRLISKLENMIILGAFLPKERLVEADLAQKMEVSRAWIRDALKNLETKGLVKMTPYRGAIVTDLTEKEVEELFQVRLVLERLANRLACENIQQSDSKSLRKIADRIKESYKKNDFNEMLNANIQFHSYITELSKNNTLIQMIAQLRIRFHIFNTFAWSIPEIVERILKEHELFITGLEKKNEELLDDLAEKHFSHSKNLYLRQLKAKNLSWIKE